jgi:hypothetical protein
MTTALGTCFDGRLLTPGDAGYDVARTVWNAMVDRRPRMIVRAATVADVATAVRFARDLDLEIGVRCGGHNVAGFAVPDDGLMIDLTPMGGVRVDPVRRRAYVQGGALLGALDRASQPYCLATTAGNVSHTGVGGLTLGGGMGWLARQHGLACDNVISFTMVTAEGEVVTASRTENPDLFWGLRGGGGNFGIVTEFEFQLHPVGPIVYAGPVMWSMDRSPELLRFYRDWITDVPDELTTAVIHRWIPAVPAIPTEFHGRPVVVVVACYAGAVEDGERVIAPLKAFAPPLLDLCRPKPFVAHQAMFDPSFPHGWWYYMRSCDVAELSDEVVDIAAARGLAINSPLTSYPIFHLGGAISRVPADSTAFGNRSSGHTFNFVGATTGQDGFAAEREWVRDSWRAIEPHQVGAYVNFLTDEGEDRIRSAYGASTYDRLKDLKRKYDPGNLFQLNQNIPPR